MNGRKLDKLLYLNTPMILFVLVWLLVYLMYGMSLYDIDKLHGYTWILLLSSNITIVLGFYICYHSHGFNQKYYDTQARQMLYCDDKKLVYLIVLLFGLSMISTVMNTYLRAQEVGGIYEYFINPMQARGITIEKSREAKFETRYIESVLAIFKNFNYVGIILSGVLFASSRRYRIISLLPILYAFIGSLSTFGRFFLITNTFLWFCSVFYVSAHLPEEDKKRNFRLLLKILIFIAVIILLYFTFIVVFRTKIMMKYSAKTGRIVELLGQHIYSYFVGNIAMLDFYLLGNIQYYYGASIFMNLIRWFNALGLYEDPRILHFFYYYDFIKTRYLLMNTYTYVRYLYSDFGEPGLILFSFIWGLLSYKALIAYLKKFTLARLYLISLVSYSLFISFFFFYFKTLFVPLYCGLTLLFIERKTGCVWMGVR